MTARILIVDDVLANIKLLEARLTAEYFTVLTAVNGPQALDICERGECDIVLLDVMMPAMNGFEVCRRLKSAPATAHLPVVMVTALDSPADRLAGLSAGADDFLTKPINELALLTRVRSLVRLKHLTDELRARTATSQGLGLPDAFAAAAAEGGQQGRVIIVEDQTVIAERMCVSLKQQHRVEIDGGDPHSLLHIEVFNPDVVVLSLSLRKIDPLRLISQVRSNDRLRNLPLLVIADLIDDPRVARALEMGVNDYLIRPLDRNELIARVATQIRKRRYQDCLRDNLRASIEMAVVDPLTRLHNRRYLQNQLSTLLRDEIRRGVPLSLLVLDIDHFKSINDAHGHDAGDEVLREFAERLRALVRGVDVVARFGGEEFVIAMPDTDAFTAERVAERIRALIDNKPFVLAGGTKKLHITISIGVASAPRSGASAEQLFKLADAALYEAKRSGRNCVRAAA